MYDWTYKIKNFFFVKDTVKKLKTKDIGIAENICKITHLIKHLYVNNKQLLTLIRKHTTTKIGNNVKDENRHFTKEDTKVAEKHMKRYLTSLLIWQIKPRG